MIDARVRAMPAAELADWRAARAADGVPLPEPMAGHQAVHLVVDGVTVGGALLHLSTQTNGLRYAVLVLQTTLPPESLDHWTAVARALEADARDRGAVSIVAAVDPGLSGAFDRVGFQATMLGTSHSPDPEARADLMVDRRVSVRPMTAEERVTFVAAAREELLAGMTRAGVLEPGTVDLGPVDERLAALTADPPPEHELLLAAVADGELVGGAWSTLLPRGGSLDWHGNVIVMRPEHRGRGLGASFLGALVRYGVELGVTDLHTRIYAYHGWARQWVLPPQDGSQAVDDVYVRKDLG